MSVSYAGFVGATAAMNSRGIGIGCDMVPALDCTPGEFGMGVLLTCRNVVQYAGELSEAVDMINASKRGVSWSYVLGDGVGEDVGGGDVSVGCNVCAGGGDDVSGAGDGWVGASSVVKALTALQVPWLLAFLALTFQ